MNLDFKAIKEHDILSTEVRLFRDHKKLMNRQIGQRSLGIGHKTTKLSSLFAALPAVLTVVALGACASDEFMGISLRPGETTTELQTLADRARAGNKQAQLNLGMLYEEGRGVARDLKKARSLYRKAAKDDAGFSWIYLPSPMEGQLGRVVQVNSGNKHPGLAEAKKKLKYMEEIN